MQTKESINKLLGEIEMAYNGTPLLPRVLQKGDGFLLQIRAYLPDNYGSDKSMSLQSGGKYYISSYAIDNEVVMTAWKAMHDYVIHEARENFLFRGERIFGPHFSVDKLHQMARISSEVKRS